MPTDIFIISVNINIVVVVIINISITISFTEMITTITINPIYQHYTTINTIIIIIIIYIINIIIIISTKNHINIILKIAPLKTFNTKHFLKDTPPFLRHGPPHGV